MATEIPTVEIMCPRCGKPHSSTSRLHPLYDGVEVTVECPTTRRYASIAGISGADIARGMIDVGEWVERLTQGLAEAD